MAEALVGLLGRQLRRKEGAPRRWELPRAMQRARQEYGSLIFGSSDDPGAGIVDDLLYRLNLVATAPERIGHLDGWLPCAVGLALVLELGDSVITTNYNLMLELAAPHRVTRQESARAIHPIAT